MEKKHLRLYLSLWISKSGASYQLNPEPNDNRLEPLGLIGSFAIADGF